MNCVIALRKLKLLPCRRQPDEQISLTFKAFPGGCSELPFLVRLRLPSARAPRAHGVRRNKASLSCGAGLAFAESFSQRLDAPHAGTIPCVRSRWPAVVHRARSGAIAFNHVNGACRDGAKVF